MIISNQQARSLPSKIWDAVVVGAGPAGSAIATQLKHEDRQVLLVERRTGAFRKLCGCCLSPQATAELEAIGVTRQSVNYSPVSLTCCTFQSESVELRLGLSDMAVMSRERLDALMIRRAIDSGVEYQEGTTVKKIELDQKANVRLLHADLSTPHQSARVTLRARTVIDASGLPATSRTKAKRRIFTPRIGIGAVLRDDHFPLEEGHLKMLIAPQGYCGLVRLEDGCIDIAAAIDPCSMHRRPAWHAISNILEHSGYTPPVDLKLATFIGKPHLTRRSPLFDQRCYRVGDAAGYVEPLTGEGIGWALRGARALATAFQQVDLERCDAAERIGRRYRRGYRAALHRDFRRCRLLTLAARNRRLWDFGMNVSKHAPAIMQRFFPQATLQPIGGDRFHVSSRQGAGES